MNMNKSISIITSIVASTTILLNSFSFTSVAKDSSYRDYYKIYGDLNNDNEINSFDVVKMRQTVATGKYVEELDFNKDGMVDSVDLTLLNDYVLGENIFFDIYFYDDSDEDNICDMFEISAFNSNPDSKDTDGDTLSDFEEIVYTNTDPTNKYTRELSITDADDDIDEDNLSNKEEITANTNPQSTDSDMDGINDYDEIKKYKTDPNNEDSDNDGIIDGDEIKLGLSPNSDMSDKVTPDNQRVFDNKIPSSSELLSHINTEEAPYEVSIDIKSAGNVNVALSVNNGSYSNVSKDNRFIGKSLFFSYDENLAVETAKIYFKPKSIDGNIEDYMIFEFFPETNYLLPVETKYTSDTAYVETNKLGTFTLVNISENEKSKSLSYPNVNVLASENTVGDREIVYDYELDNLEIAFFIDISGCLSESLEETKKSIHDCCKAVFEHSDSSYIELLGYYSSPDLSTNKILSYADSVGNTILNNINSVDEALDALEPVTTNTKNNLNNGIYILDNVKNTLYSSDCSKKYAFIISNSDYSFTDNLGYEIIIPNKVKDSLEDIYDTDIHLNFLLSSGIFNRQQAVNNLKDACNPYNFGVYSNLETGYFGNTGFARIYSDSITDLSKSPVYHITTLEPHSIPTEVNRNTFINSLPSTFDVSKVPAADKNGNINFKDAAVEIGVAYYDKNGNLVFKTMLEVCNDYDLTKNGYDQLMSKKDTSTKLINGSIQIVPFSDKLLYQDTDGDGIPDAYDPYPDEPFDERFEIIDDYNYEPNIDFVDKHYSNSQECYNSVLPEPNTIGRLFAQIAFFLRDSDSFADFISSKVNQTYFDFGLHEERKNNSSAIPHAFDAIRHYFKGTGKEVLYSQEDTCEIISSSYQNMLHFFDNINRTMRCFEEILKENNSITLSLKSNQKLKAVCLINNKGENDTKEPIDIVNCEINEENSGLKSHLSFYCNYIHRDWNLTIGEALGTIVATAERNGNQFSMKYRYYFKDIYEWAYHYEIDDNSISKPLHAAHESGVAQEYLMTGYFEGYLKWNLDEKVVSKNVYTQLFSTLHDKTNDDIWDNSNETDRFNKYKLLLE